EVETIRAALTAVEWPDDELSVFATLRGSLLAIPDDLLLRFRAEHPSFHPFRPLSDDLPEEFLPIAEALGLLQRLHRERNRVPIVETVHELLRHTRAHAGFALRPAGNQVLANVQRICDLARSFEVRGGLSFRGFVERLAEEAERPGSAHGPILEEGAEGVRIMTAHSAKGLEFPIVVLADITARLTPTEPSLYVDARSGLCASKLLGCSPWELLEKAALELQRDRAEGIRLAYVAATRARDLLVVPAVGDEPWEGGWVSPLNKAIYPPFERARLSEPAPGCPRFGDTTVLERSQQFDGDADTSIRPGLHRPQAGDHRVVWWDPRVLKLDVEGNFGVRQEEILSPDGADDAVAQGLDRYEAWIETRRDAIEDGSRPELEVVVVSLAKEGPPEVSGKITVETVSKARQRPSGPRFGTLVHTILRDVAFDAEGAAIRSLAELHGRMLDATTDEVAAAAGAVGNALRHPLLARAAASPRCHREAPLVLKLDDETVVEGTIDLLFREDGAWVVVDFKTDAELESVGERYRQQLEWYLFAVERLTKEPASGVLLGI
ncbi:MAG: ATP-dependent deoxyribonuclease subunit A, partial [bacterium]|nr:ATP-dependent deoxyribonuclease subunit A [bacterium]